MDPGDETGPTASPLPAIGPEGQDLHLERGTEHGFDRSSALLDRGLVAPQSSPRQQASRRGQAVPLADALAQRPASIPTVTPVMARLLAPRLRGSSLT